MLKQQHQRIDCARADAAQTAGGAGDAASALRLASTLTAPKAGLGPRPGLAGEEEKKPRGKCGLGRAAGPSGHPLHPDTALHLSADCAGSSLLETTPKKHKSCTNSPRPF